MYQGALRIKFKKVHRLYNQDHTSWEQRFFYPKFSDLGVQAIDNGKLTNRHIETGRRYIRRKLKKGSFMKINMFPYLPFTKKPVSARMGKGKGRVYGWVFPCKKGRVLYEVRLNILSSLKIERLTRTLKGISKKMPVRVKIIKLIY